MKRKQRRLDVEPELIRSAQLVLQSLRDLYALLRFKNFHYSPYGIYPNLEGRRRRPREESVRSRADGGVDVGVRTGRYRGVGEAGVGVRHSQGRRRVAFFFAGGGAGSRSLPSAVYVVRSVRDFDRAVC